MMAEVVQQCHSWDNMQAELATVAECACFREEQNKECFMEAGYGISLLQLLQRHSSGAASTSGATQARSEAAGQGLPEPLIVGACGVLRALTTADDDRPPSSKAFINARLLARQHQVGQNATARSDYLQLVRVCVVVGSALISANSCPTMGAPTSCRPCVSCSPCSSAWPPPPQHPQQLQCWLL
jgi:hypothetical protein